MACKNCNDCNDNGCPAIVYPDCILTKIAYPCLGLAAGKTGTQVLAAIEAAICAIPAAPTVVGCVINSGTPEEMTTITVTPTTTGYKVCLGQDVIDSINSLGDTVDTLVTCVAPGGVCAIPAIEAAITAIEGDVTTLQTDVAALEDETWKTFDAAGNMANGQPIPTLNAAVTPVTARLRRHGANHVEIQLVGDVTVGVLGAQTLFTLPTGYRPATPIAIPVTGWNSTTTAVFIGQIQITTLGVATLSIIETVPAGNEVHELAFLIQVPLD